MQLIDIDTQPCSLRSNVSPLAASRLHLRYR